MATSLPPTYYGHKQKLAISMQLHKDPIFPGDSIFDTVDGPLKVLDVGDNHFTVRLSGGQFRDYNASGKCQTRRVPTAYWHDPVVLLPRKNAESWAAQKANIKAVVGILKAQAGLVD